MSSNGGIAAGTDALLRAVAACRGEGGFDPLVRGIVDAFDAVGLRADRVQLPLDRTLGFRHPVFSSVVITWRRGQPEEVTVMRHDETSADWPIQLRAMLASSPFSQLMWNGQDRFRARIRPQDPLSMGVLCDLRDQGYRDYLALSLDMPDGVRQPVSITSLTGFPDDAVERAEGLRSALALAVYSVYQASVARQVAATYVGPRSGMRVLSGDIVRGNARSLDAGILFGDVRDFTLLSEVLEVGQVVDVVNTLFDAVGDSVDAQGGEILKFMGDAMLIIFPIDEQRSRAQAADAMVNVARSSARAIAQLPIQKELPLSMDFGGHVGQVLLGNIGTRERLDFTVMGPAVNLASRLEGLCRSLSEQAVFSDAVAQARPGLRPLGSYRLKGVAQPVDVAGLTRT